MIDKTVCPVCGSEEVEILHFRRGQAWVVHIVCTACSNAQRSVVVGDDEAGSVEDAVLVWKGSHGE
jgi:hypothetical protein